MVIAWYQECNRPHHLSFPSKWDNQLERYTIRFRLLFWRWLLGNYSLRFCRIDKYTLLNHYYIDNMSRFSYFQRQCCIHLSWRGKRYLCQSLHDLLKRILLQLILQLWHSSLRLPNNAWIYARLLYQKSMYYMHLQLGMILIQHRTLWRCPCYGDQMQILNLVVSFLNQLLIATNFPYQNCQAQASHLFHSYPKFK